MSTQKNGDWDRYPEHTIITRGVRGLDVTLWIDMIKRRLNDAPPAIVTKVEHFKCTGRFSNEFLAIHLKHPIRTGLKKHPTVLFIDRVAYPDFLIAPGFKSPSFPSSILARERISIPPPDQNYMQFVSQERGEQRPILLSRLDFSQHPTDEDLLNILEFASEKHPPHENDYQGFWYAGLVFDALSDRFPSQRYEERADERGSLIGKCEWAKLKDDFEGWV
ncbi:hypothetical protein HETIRDRAFT_104564 [Heterobasidion irregulare TC 32-1]|uniref:Uncharacterized protein n=1 Tax=Heterobasidion irregulare (strain TC 32-1) TaxID=747525 RepID=W4K0K0_HETIT|nr:uncharacterized protein HETIRDRAFT_104564 [Heterobasidion irregulare TC 32-1]ETW79302.1 hypothetical protein HETIRDRAFT_104564 [Heterobasidion irregulare TC 32-1]